MLQVLASGETVEVPPVSTRLVGRTAHGGGGRPCAAVERDPGRRAARRCARRADRRRRARRRDRRQLAWVPRRAGERGAVEAGALPNLLPGGRAVADADARGQVGRATGRRPSRPSPGRDTAGHPRRRGRAGQLGALVVAGVDPDDLPDPAAALRRDRRRRRSSSASSCGAAAVTERADVVFPVAAAVEKAGTFLDWEGRSRPFEASLTDAGRLPDLEVLDALADALDVHLGLPDVRTARAELAGARHLGPSARRRLRRSKPGPPAKLGAGQAILATLARAARRRQLARRRRRTSPATAKPLRARLSAATRAGVGCRRRRAGDGRARDAGRRSRSTCSSPRCPTASCGCPPARWQRGAPHPRRRRRRGRQLEAGAPGDAALRAARPTGRDAASSRPVTATRGG